MSGEEEDDDAVIACASATSCSKVRRGGETELERKDEDEGGIGG